MKKTSKLMAFLAVGVMSAAMLGACGANNTATSSETSAEPSAEASKEASAEASEAPAASDATTGDEVTADTSGETYKVYLVTMDQMDQHWVNVNSGAEKAAKELGNVDLKWVAPDVKDDAKQIEMVNQAIADKTQAIIVAANGPDAITNVLEEAASKDIKIVYVDSPANKPVGVQTIATDNVAAGKQAGDILIAALKEKGVTSGEIGILNTNASSNSTLDRESGFRSAFEGTEFKILETQYTEGDPSRSKDAATNYIAQGVVGLFGANEGTTVGVGNAIKEAGSDKVLGVGFDKSDMILSLVKDGSLLATMAQNPDVMGYEGVMSAVKAIKGETVSPEYIDSGVTAITLENIDALK